MIDENKIHIATQVVPFAKSSNNPWGDTSRILILTFRLKDACGAVSKYFKICDKTHRPFEMTDDEFNEACVHTLLANAEKPTLVSI